MQALRPSRTLAAKPRRLRFFAVHLALPIIIGGLIYLCWREPNLLMFTWLRGLGLESSTNALRNFSAPAQRFIPHWMIYSLPDGLWAYALTAFMIFLWRDKTRMPVRWFWLSLGFLIAAGAEIGQLAGIVPGTFDFADLIICAVAPAAAALFTSAKFIPFKSIAQRRLNEAST